MSSHEMPGATPVSIAPGGRPLGYREALRSPCLSCPTSPCCSHLELQTIRLRAITDLDHAIYLLNFDGIVMELDPAAADLRVYLNQPCVHLDQPSGLCRVHGTPEQPSICAHYSAYTCGYRTAMLRDVDPEVPRVDRRRMAWYADQVVFDDDRRIIETPAPDTVLEAFGRLPLQLTPAPVPGPDPMLEAWKSIAISAKPVPEEGGPRRFSDPVVTDPCQSCPAYCCSTLIFPRAIPKNASEVDLLRYALGFPSVEIGVADDGWAVIIHTSCRHLDGDRCAAYGTDERPLKCSSYDALRCTYRENFATPVPEGIVRVTRDQFPTLAESIMFDEVGDVIAAPAIDVVRQYLVRTERARAGITVT